MIDIIHGFFAGKKKEAIFSWMVFSESTVKLAWLRVWLGYENGGGLYKVRVMNIILATLGLAREN